VFKIYISQRTSGLDTNPTRTRKINLLNASFILIGVYPTLTVFHLYSSLSSRLPHQPISALRSLTNQCPLYFSTNQLVSMSTSACFNVTFTYKYRSILFSHPILAYS